MSNFRLFFFFLIFYRQFFCSVWARATVCLSTYLNFVITNKRSYVEGGAKKWQKINKDLCKHKLLERLGHLANKLFLKRHCWKNLLQTRPINLVGCPQVDPHVQLYVFQKQVVCSLFNYFVLQVQFIVNMCCKKVAIDWIRTRGLRCQQRPQPIFIQVITFDL